MSPHRKVQLERWQIVAAFVVLVVAFAGGLLAVQKDSASISQLRHTTASIRELQRTRASIAQLQRTNCSLKQFLETAEKTRRQAAAHETGQRRRQDLAAARGYADLSSRFRDGAVGPHCGMPAP